MPRTTINIDAPVLKDLKRVQKRDGRSLGRLVSEMLAESLAHYEARKRVPRVFAWVSKQMGPRVNIADKEALYAAMEGESKRLSRRGKRP